MNNLNEQMAQPVTPSIIVRALSAGGDVQIYLAGLLIITSCTAPATRGCEQAANQYKWSITEHMYYVHGTKDKTSHSQVFFLGISKDKC